MEHRAALRYAQALMDLGEERSSLQSIAEDLLTLETTMHNSRELRSVLASPVVHPDKKLAILTEVFGKQVNREIMSFITLLVKKGRAELLLATAEEFRKLSDARTNIVHAQVTSAIKLTEEEQRTIVNKLTAMSGKHIHATFSLDESLKGGFIARVGDTLVDASLSHQLDLLREQFKQGGAVLN